MYKMKTLIDKASKVCFSDGNLATQLGVAPSVISDMRHGHRTMSPETAAMLADIAGVNPVLAAIEAMLTRAEGTSRGLKLREIFEKPATYQPDDQTLPAHSVQGVLFRASPSPKGPPPGDCFLVG